MCAYTYAWHAIWKSESIFTYILTWPSSASTTCWWSSDLSVWPLGVLLLDVRIQSWVAKVGLNAILALKVSSFYIVLRSSLSFVILIFCAVLVVVIIVVVNLSIWWLDLLGSNLVELVGHLHVLKLLIVGLDRHVWNLLQISVIHWIPLHHLALTDAAIRHVVYR